MLRIVTLFGTILVSTLLTSGVQAACTYNEAVMAMNSGNLVRGQALMKMAARDGDQRAVQFLAGYDDQSDQLLAGQTKTGQLKPGQPRPRKSGKSLSDLLLVLDSPSSAHTSAPN